MQAVDKFIGMFAIALHDKSRGKIILIRDRAGVKPLYYYDTGGLFLFVSELKSFSEHPELEKKVDRAALVLYLQFGYVPQPHTIFENTHKLRSGHYLEYDIKSGRIEDKAYWDVIDWYNKPKLDVSGDEAVSPHQGFLHRPNRRRLQYLLSLGQIDNCVARAIFTLQVAQSNRVVEGLITACRLPAVGTL
jgi:asparagine synthase (glutamine-hydrolysing)